MDRGVRAEVDGRRRRHAWWFPVDRRAEFLYDRRHDGDQRGRSHSMRFGRCGVGSAPSTVFDDGSRAEGASRCAVAAAYQRSSVRISRQDLTAANGGAVRSRGVLKDCRDTASRSSRTSGGLVDLSSAAKGRSRSSRASLSSPAAGATNSVFGAFRRSTMHGGGRRAARDAGAVACRLRSDIPRSGGDRRRERVERRSIRR